jgi:hypothetical protein
VASSAGNYQDTITDPLSHEFDNGVVGKYDGEEDEVAGEEDITYHILSGVEKERAIIFIVQSTNVNSYL